MHQFKIFIVEDDPWYAEVLEYHLSLNPDFTIERFETGAQLLSRLNDAPDFISIDYSLPDMDGVELYHAIRKTLQDVPVVVVSGQENISVAIQLLKIGVHDYILKDEHTKDLLWNSVLHARERKELRDEVEELKNQLGRRYDFQKIICGESAQMQRVYQLIEKASKTSINVSITGETGTGKELVAKAIHYSGLRGKKKFVAVNMAAIPADLIESELFGHEKGAFTGATARKTGKFEEANGGTIFLDEIAELNLNLQSKILRVLQERELNRVGGNETVALDVRVICATHRNLLEEVRKGNFREDLYYRIIGLPIELPPLRERGSDVLLLAKQFISEFTKNNQMNDIHLNAQARQKLLAHDFPGNVRELKHLVELACVLCDGKEIQPDDIAIQNLKSDEVQWSGEKTMRQYECDIISSYLKKYDGDVVLVAKKLAIGKSTIYQMIKNNEINLSK